MRWQALLSLLRQGREVCDCPFKLWQRCREMLGRAAAFSSPAQCPAPRTGNGARGGGGLRAQAAMHAEPRSSQELQDGTEVVGTVVWAGPKGAKVLLENKVIGFMPTREAPYFIRDSVEEPATPGGMVGARRVCNTRTCLTCPTPHACAPATTSTHPFTQACNLPKGLVRPFKVIGRQSKASQKSGPLLSARLCDLDVLWQRAAQLCEVSTQVSCRAHFPLSMLSYAECKLCRVQHKENVTVIIDGANSGGLLARFDGLAMFVPVSQLGPKGHNEWWTEQVGRLG